MTYIEIYESESVWDQLCYCGFNRAAHTDNGKTLKEDLRSGGFLCGGFERKRWWRVVRRDLGARYIARDCEEDSCT